jgi:hypothetical protein
MVYIRVKWDLLFEGDSALVESYRRSIMAEHVFKSGERQANLGNLREEMQKKLEHASHHVIR